MRAYINHLDAIIPEQGCKEYHSPRCVVVEVEPYALLAESAVEFHFGTRVNDEWDDDVEKNIE